MKYLVKQKLLASIAALLALSFTIAGQGVAQDWTPLFDGKTLEGWNQKGGKAVYEVVDGAIVGASVPNSPNSFLCTNKNYGDFELQLKFKVHPELNSGIQIRSNSLEDYKNGRVHGYQVEIDPSDRGYTAGIYDESRRGWLYPITDDVTARYAFRQNDWNHLRVHAVGDRIRTWLNGHPISDLKDDMTASGFIGLQVHGVGKREDPLTVSWKEILIRENPTEKVAQDALQSKVHKATAMKVSDFQRLARGAEVPDPNSVTDKSLTLALMSFQKNEIPTAAQNQEFAFVPEVDPAQLAREILRNGIATMVHKNRIQSFSCIESGDQAKGVFRFKVPNLYQGSIHYKAKKIEGEWEFTEFHLPANGIAVAMGDDGNWQSLQSKAKPVFDADVEIKKLADGFKFTEGPSLGPDGRIYFNDIPNSNTHVFDPASGETSLFRNFTGRANGLFWTPGGRLLSCEGGERRVSLSLDGNVTTVVDKIGDTKLNSPNDLVIDTAGGIYFTDPRYGNRDDMEMESEDVYFLPRGNNKKLVRVIDDFKQPNGIIFSPDFKTLYVADLGSQKIWAYDIAGPGKLENKRLFYNMGSDGMSVDTQGNIYLTNRGAIHVIAPMSGTIEENGDEMYGKKIAELKMPEGPANCLLVGDTLYVTARTGFYSVKTNRLGIDQ